jgi:D-glycero-D-manno-heptose 1,7-bisphosphate phosphatase
MKFVFLDRDGVINEFPGDGLYVTTLKGLRLLPRSLDAIRILTEAGYAIFVISNQAGVGRGIYSKEKLLKINKKLLDGIAKAGGRIKKVYYCTHPSYLGCGCRKPEIENIRKAAMSVGKTIRAIKKSFFVGDTKSDILTGFNAKCKTVLALSGRATRREVRTWGVKPDFIVKDLLDAVPIILEDRDPPVDRTRQHEVYLKKNGIRIRTGLRK